MKRSNAPGQAMPHQAAGLLCATLMSLAMLFGTNSLATAPAVQASPYTATHPVVTPA